VHTTLLTASPAAEGDECVSVAELLLAAGVPATVADENGEGVTPLHALAATKVSRHRSARMVALLVAHGAQVAACETNILFTPLHSAARAGNQDATAALLSHGADVAALATFMHTPLHVAAASGHADVVRLLLRAGAPVDAMLTKTDSLDAQTALGLAAERGLVDVAHILLDAGANVLLRDRDERDFTALYHAVMSGHAPVVELLLQRGADANLPCLRTHLGARPLHFAALNGHAHLVPILLRHGADVNGVDAQSRTALHDAASHGETAVAARLLEHGADARIERNSDGATALHVSITKQHTNFTMLMFLHHEPLLAETDKDALRHVLADCFFSAAAANCGWLLDWHARHSRLAMHDLPWTEVTKRVTASTLCLSGICDDDDVDDDNAAAWHAASHAWLAAAAWPVVFFLACAMIVASGVVAYLQRERTRPPTMRTSRSLRARAAVNNAQPPGAVRALHRSCLLLLDAVQCVWHVAWRCWVRFIAAATAVMRACASAATGATRAVAAAAAAAQRSWQHVVTRRTAVPAAQRLPDLGKPHSAMQAACPTSSSEEEEEEEPAQPTLQDVQDEPQQLAGAAQQRRKRKARKRRRGRGTHAAAAVDDDDVVGGSCAALSAAAADSSAQHAAATSDAAGATSAEAPLEASSDDEKSIDDAPTKNEIHVAEDDAAVSDALHAPAVAAAAPPAPAAPAAAVPPPLAPPAQKECCVCMEEMDADALLLLFPCGHRCICAACVATLQAAPPAARRCPKCRVPVQGVSRVFEE
jgi:ankyrin repeat protein